jgi:hypothetical protein
MRGRRKEPKGRNAVSRRAAPSQSDNSEQKTRDAPGALPAARSPPLLLEEARHGYSPYLTCRFGADSRRLFDDVGRLR